MSGFEKILHTDVLHARDQRVHFETDKEIAKSNLDQIRADDERNILRSEHLAHMAAADRDRRGAHHYRYKLMTQAAMYAPLFDETANYPEASLLDLDARTASMTDEDRERALIYGGKGISLELGHVDQLGDWDVARPLDAAVRELPNSVALQEAGFLFGETYDAKEKAKVTYRFYITDRDHGHGPFIRAVRRRAAADVLTEANHSYEIVKSSSFMIDETELTQSQLDKLREVKRRSSSSTDDLSNEAGRAIVEPFIMDKAMRQRSTSVLAINSLYFALRRH